MGKQQLPPLPDSEELFLRDNPDVVNKYAYQDEMKISITRNTYEYAWHRSKMYFCNQILDYIRVNKLDKEVYKPVLELISGRELNEK